MRPKYACLVGCCLMVPLSVLAQPKSVVPAVPGPVPVPGNTTSMQSASTKLPMASTKSSGAGETKLYEVRLSPKGLLEKVQIDLNGQLTGTQLTFKTQTFGDATLPEGQYLEQPDVPFRIGIPYSVTLTHLGTGKNGTGNNRIPAYNPTTCSVILFAQPKNTDGQLVVVNIPDGPSFGKMIELKPDDPKFGKPRYSTNIIDTTGTAVPIGTICVSDLEATQCPRLYSDVQNPVDLELFRRLSELAYTPKNGQEATLDAAGYTLGKSAEFRSREDAMAFSRTLRPTRKYFHSKVFKRSVPLGGAAGYQDTIPVTFKALDCTEYWSDLVTGYGATLFECEQLKLFVLAFRGTDDWKDWPNNIVQSVAGPYVTPQYKLAVDLATAIIKDRHLDSPNGPRLIVTGHSLGGGLASWVSLSMGLEGIGFNPAPISWAVPEFTALDFDAASRRFLNVRSQDDPVSMLPGMLVGPVMTVKSKAAPVWSALLMPPTDLANLTYHPWDIGAGGRVSARFAEALYQQHRVQNMDVDKIVSLMQSR